MFRNGERMGTIKFTQFQGRLFDAASFYLMNSVFGDVVLCNKNTSKQMEV